MSESQVDIRGLSKRYGRREVLRDVSLAIRPGCVTAIVGPNAAGKSTLMKAILGLVRSSPGSEITVAGARVGSDVRYREHVGYMPQGARFPDQLRGDDLIALLKGLRGHPAEVDEELIDAFDLRQALSQPVPSMSGGTRQKLNAATAFLFRPSLVLLDEPTAGLDPNASRILLDKVRRATAAGTTVIVTSHILREVEELAQDIVYLAEGRVRFHGTPQALLAETGEATIERALGVLLLRAA